MVKGDRWCLSPGLRRTSAAVAIAALAVGGVKIANDYNSPGSGFSTVATVAADPTGPTGPGGGGMTGPPGGGSEFQPPGVPSLPDYQGGNQPPLDQNNGISIYNSGVQGAPQQPSQAGGPQQGLQPGQNADGSWNRAANGEQNPPNYSTAPAYTGTQSIPNTAAPQPQQGQQSPQQSGQSNQNPQATQAPTQTQQPGPNNQQDQQTQQQCQTSAISMGIPPEQLPMIMLAGITAAGSLLTGPGRDVTGDECSCTTPEQSGPQHDDQPTPQNVTGSETMTATPTPTEQKQNCLPDNGDFVAALQRIFPGLSHDDAVKYAGPLLKTMKEFGINSTPQQAAFLGEIGGESSGFVYWSEQPWNIKPGQTPEDYFNNEPMKYQGRKDLGNIMDTDGYRFRGQGPIQVTGRHNTQDVEEFLGLIPKTNVEGTVVSTILGNLVPLPYILPPPPGANLTHLNLLADGALLSDPNSREAGIRSAGWYFTNGGAKDGQEVGPTGETYTAQKMGNLNNVAKNLTGPDDFDGFDNITLGVRGAAADNAADRRQFFQTAWKELDKLKNQGCLQ